MQGYSLPPACSDEPGGMNQTANTVAVKHIETPQPPHLQDSLNPRAGSHVLHTENNFEQELFSGTPSLSIHMQLKKYFLYWLLIYIIFP